VNIYNRGTIIDFYKRHPDARTPLEVWYKDVEARTWENPNQLKRDYGGTVSILKNSRAVFDIKGNDYRLVAEINYENGWLFIKFLGRHNEYDKVDANTVDRFRKRKS
jgi:mRNA interferase HigB